MLKTSLRFDSKLKEKIDNYCAESNKKLSDAIRYFIELGLAQHQQKKAHGYSQTVGKNSLMLNEKRNIRASIETLYLLRQLIKEPEVIDQAANKTLDILESGWNYN